MRTTSIETKVMAGLALSLFTTMAQAHPGHGGWASGLLHPWSGWDHMAAMVAVGLWAMTLQGSKRLVLPLAFIAATLLGAILPMSALFLSMAEQGIILSLLVMGGGLLMALRMPWQVAAILMAVAGVCHGYAHAAEIPVGQSVNAFIGGMFVSTAVLHAFGIAAAMVTMKLRPELARYWGAPVALVGALGLIG